MKEQNFIKFPYLISINARKKLFHLCCMYYQIFDGYFRLGDESSTIVRLPQHAPKIHFSCALIEHLEHNHSTPHFWAKKKLN